MEEELHYYFGAKQEKYLSPDDAREYVKQICIHTDLENTDKQINSMTSLQCFFEISEEEFNEKLPDLILEKIKNEEVLVTKFVTKQSIDEVLSDMERLRRIF